MRCSKWLLRQVWLYHKKTKCVKYTAPTPRTQPTPEPTPTPTTDDKIETKDKTNKEEEKEKWSTIPSIFLAIIVIFVQN